MEQNPADNEILDPRIPFAAERTLLAWIRTGLAMMGFGFVVARFGLFLREIAATHLSANIALPAPPEHHVRFSLWAGTVLVAGGFTRKQIQRRRQPKETGRKPRGMTFEARGLNGQ